MREKRKEDEATPSSGMGPTNGRQMVGVLNASRDEEFINDFPASLGPKW